MGTGVVMATKHVTDTPNTSDADTELTDVNGYEWPKDECDECEEDEPTDPHEIDPPDGQDYDGPDYDDDARDWPDDYDDEDPFEPEGGAACHT